MSKPQNPNALQGLDPTTEKAIAKMMETVPEISLDDETGVTLNSLRDAYVLAAVVVHSGWAPKGIDDVNKAVICFLQAKQAGIPPLVALWYTAPINNRPTMYGDLPLALVKSRRPELRVVEYWERGEERLERRPSYASKGEFPDELAAVCEITERKTGELVARERFTVRDAKLFSASWWGQERGQKIHGTLWEKPGPWQDTPYRMLLFRARTFALRSAAPEVITGLPGIFEEEIDSGQREPEYEVRPVTPRDLATPPAQREGAKVAAALRDSAEEVDGAPASPEPEPDDAEADEPEGNGDAETEAVMDRIAELVDRRRTPASEVSVSDLADAMRRHEIELDSAGRFLTIARCLTQLRPHGADRCRRILAELQRVNGKRGGSESSAARPASEPRADEIHAGDDDADAEPEAQGEEERITPGQRLVLLQAIDKGRVTREQVAAGCRALFGVADMNALSRAQADQLADAIDDATLFDAIEKHEEGAR